MTIWRGPSTGLGGGLTGMDEECEAARESQSLSRKLPLGQEDDVTMSKNDRKRKGLREERGKSMEKDQIPWPACCADLARSLASNGRWSRKKDGGSIVACNSRRATNSR